MGIWSSSLGTQLGRQVSSSAGTKFEWRDHTLDCLDHWYNTTALNERAIEVPIATAWHYDHELMDPDILEVGNVLMHYGWSGHHVVDLYEVESGVENISLFNVHKKYDRILAISTLEHVDSYNQPDQYGPMIAVSHLYNLLKPGGEMLVTIPFGQQPFLDVAILNDELRQTQQDTLTWESDHWKTHNDHAVWMPARENGWPQAVWVATWTKEI